MFLHCFYCCVGYIHYCFHLDMFCLADQKLFDFFLYYFFMESSLFPILYYVVVLIFV